MVDDERCEILVDELLRVVVALPLLVRVAQADGTVGSRRVRSGDRLLLVSRHAVDAHRYDPDCVRPAPAYISQLVFGAGPHACPGARLARAQLTDTLRAWRLPAGRGAGPGRSARRTTRLASLVVRAGSAR